MKIIKILLIVLYVLMGLFILYLTNTQNKIDKKIIENAEAMREIEAVAMQDILVVDGQEIYVPAYSSIKSVDGKSDLLLSVNLSVRNTDPFNPIFLSYVDFYNTAGAISKRFLDSPITIGPMATKYFHIAQEDTIGGIGANFYLEWVADTTVNEPVVEAIMMASSGTQGYSWSTHGLVVKQAKKNE
jgi:hypothetical protein